MISHSMKKTLLPLLILGISACMTPQRITVTNLHDLASFPENCSVFSLPRTRIHLEFKAVRHQYTPGPYQRYANDLLGINGVPDLSETQWELLQLSTTNELIPDPDYYFSLAYSGGGAASSCLNSLFEKKLLVDPASYSPFFGSVGIDGHAPEAIHFTDLSVKSNFKEPKKSTKSRPETPVDFSKKNADDKASLEDKAREAAAFIYKIRKRRFKLISGQYDTHPESTALETAVRELNELEDNYLALFIGRYTTDTLTHRYQYIPTSGSTPERAIICHFSGETGFSDAESATGKPIVLNIQNLNHTEILKEVQISRESSSYENTVLYRIPERAAVQVILGSSLLLDTEFMIFQYGAFVPARIN